MRPRASCTPRAAATCRGSICVRTRCSRRSARCAAQTSAATDSLPRAKPKGSAYGDLSGTKSVKSKVITSNRPRPAFPRWPRRGATPDAALRAPGHPPPLGCLFLFYFHFNHLKELCLTLAPTYENSTLCAAVRPCVPRPNLPSTRLHAGGPAWPSCGWRAEAPVAARGRSPARRSSGRA